MINASVACNQSLDSKFPAPKEYDLNNPVKIRLPTDLDEISGIVYYPRDTSIFAIHDETGILYKIFPDRNTAVQKWKFGKGEDFEDLQLIDSTFYILASKGNIVSLKFFSADSITVQHFNFSEKGKDQFESLYFDKASGKLNLICKDCEKDTKHGVSVWTFDTSTKEFDHSPLEINTKNLDKITNEKKFKFKPSGAAINPLTNELYIISSVNKLLVIADATGVIKKAYRLNQALYKQPEGIAFTPSGDLLISNEAAGEGAANILVLKHKRKTK